MKKIILFLFLFNLYCFAEWNTINIEDEFGDDSTEVAIINSNSDGGWLRVRKVLEYLPVLDENGGYIIKDSKVVYSKETKEKIEVDVKFNVFLGGEKTYIKLKNEKNEISEEIMGHVWKSNANIFTISELDTPKFLDFIKKSKTIKIAATKYNGSYFSQLFNVKNFSENESKIIGGFDY